MERLTREMNKEERNVIEFIVTEMLQNAVSTEYAKAILSHKDESTGNTFMENVIRDVLENSAWKDTGHYSVSDVKFAIGRTLMEKLGIVRAKGDEWELVESQESEGA